MLGPDDGAGGGEGGGVEGGGGGGLQGARGRWITAAAWMALER